MPVTALRRHRKNRSLSQVQLARLLDIEQQTVSLYETGGSRPGTKRVRRALEETFGMPLAELLAIENESDDAANGNVAA